MGEERPGTGPGGDSASGARVARNKKSTKGENGPRTFTPGQRLLILDIWERSEAPAAEFGGLVGLSPHTLYTWRKRFKEQGPAGLMDQVRGAPRGSRVPEPTQRAILMLKRSHPDWGIDRLHDMLLRGEGFAASPGAIEVNDGEDNDCDGLIDEVGLMATCADCTERSVSTILRQFPFAFREQPRASRTTA